MKLQRRFDIELWFDLLMLLFESLLAWGRSGWLRIGHAVGQTAEIIEVFQSYWEFAQELLISDPSIAAFVRRKRRVWRQRRELSGRRSEEFREVSIKFPPPHRISIRHQKQAA